MCNGSHPHLAEYGTIELKAYLRTALPASLTVLCLGVFDSTLMINKYRQISLDYQI